MTCEERLALTRPSGTYEEPAAITAGRCLRHEVYPRSDAAGLSALSLHALLLAASALLAEVSVLGWVLQGVVLTFLFCPLHESLHGTAFRTRALHDAIGIVIGALLILPPAWFAAFHVAHHKHTQDPTLDPEIRWSGFRPADARKTGPHLLCDRLWILSGAAYWRERIATTLTYAQGTVPRTDQCFVHTQRLAFRLIREARLFVAFYALVLAVAAMGGGSLLWRHWFGPALVGQPFLRVYLVAEHTGCELVHEPARSRAVELSATALRRARRHSRTSAPHIFPRLLTRVLFWNMPYHAEHHAFPDVPFHHLPALSAALRGGANADAAPQHGEGCRGEGILSAYWHDLRATRGRGG